MNSNETILDIFKMIILKLAILIWMASVNFKYFFNTILLLDHSGKKNTRNFAFQLNK